MKKLSAFFLLFSVLHAQSVVNIPNTTFPTVRTLLNQNFSVLNSRTTTNVPEGTNLYYTVARVLAGIAANTIAPLNISLPAGGTVSSPDPFSVTKAYVAASGTAQAQVVTLSSSITTTNAGLYFCFLPVADNTGAAPAIAVNGLTALPVVKPGATSLVAVVAHDLKSVAPACVVSDGSEFILQNTASTTGASLSTVTTRDLFVGGIASGAFASNWNIAGQGGANTGANLPYMALTADAYIGFTWPTNWDNSQPVNILLTVTDYAGSGGNFKIDFSVSCVANNTAMGSGLTYNSSVSTSSQSFTGGGLANNSKNYTISTLPYGSCADNDLAVLLMHRDTGVSGNSADAIGVMRVALQYSIK
jgi:hypothetical protein